MQTNIHQQAHEIQQHHLNEQRDIQDERPQVDVSTIQVDTSDVSTKEEETQQYHHRTSMAAESGLHVFSLKPKRHKKSWY